MPKKPSSAKQDLSAKAKEYANKNSNKPPMKETPADEEVRDNTFRVAAKELRQFIERFERLDAEKQDISDAQKEVMGEAKGRGYDTRTIRRIVSLRKRDANDVANEDALLDMY